MVGKNPTMTILETTELTTEMRTSPEASTEITTEVRTSPQASSEITTEVRTSPEASSEITTEVRTSPEASSEITTKVRTSPEALTDFGSSALSTVLKTTFNSESSSGRINSLFYTSDKRTSIQQTTPITDRQSTKSESKSTNLGTMLQTTTESITDMRTRATSGVNFSISTDFEGITSSQSSAVPQPPSIASQDISKDPVKEYSEMTTHNPITQTLTKSSSDDKHRNVYATSIQHRPLIKSEDITTPSKFPEMVDLQKEPSQVALGCSFILIVLSLSLVVIISDIPRLLQHIHYLNAFYGWLFNVDQRAARRRRVRL
ncbi:hypothetical protein CAPTEDRAFT_204390 [Capitella teleta]|uniref:Uncharacterized protein n=1 Tax=Capitella teleta TaxID=283909 RepID=R7TWB5_CAPTE|nr:hypothetical protein CAPTEDRAFT_204390 [Capitella teleta]|eukprot:ELT97867.1 hypothetical protein CAPTEDRAFT_204390 [Capitella teleta]